jgi:hypothetical protein
LHERLVAGRDRLNGYDGAVHRRRAPWDISAYEAQCALIGLIDRHGVAAQTPVRIWGANLTALDATSMRRFTSDLSSSGCAHHRHPAS